MKVINLIILNFILLLPLVIADDKYVLYGDTIVEKIIDQKIVKVKNLREAEEANSRVFTDDSKRLTIENFFKSYGMTYKNMHVIEEYVFMRLTVMRVRISISYDLIIQLGLNSYEKDTIFSVIVFPHREKKYGSNLLDSKKWGGIKAE